MGNGWNDIDTKYSENDTKQFEGSMFCRNDWSEHCLFDTMNSCKNGDICNKMEVQTTQSPFKPTSEIIFVTINKFNIYDHWLLIVLGMVSIFRICLLSMCGIYAIYSRKYAVIQSLDVLRAKKLNKHDDDIDDEQTETNDDETNDDETESNILEIATNNVQTTKFEEMEEE